MSRKKTLTKVVKVKQTFFSQPKLVFCQLPQLFCILQQPPAVQNTELGIKTKFLDSKPKREHPQIGDPHIPLPVHLGIIIQFYKKMDIAKFANGRTYGQEKTDF